MMKNRLLPKKLLKIFVVGAVLVAALGTTFAVSAQSSCGATYVVKPGDYLTKIARTCGVSYSNLLKANPNITTPSLIYSGQVINIPSAGIPVTGAGSTIYTVQQGDTLYSIGQHFNLTVADLREANPSVGTTITVGQVLNIPERIRFATGATAAVVEGQLAANRQKYYLLSAGAGQTLDVTLTAPSDLTLGIYGADGSTVMAASSKLGFRGVLPKTQDYILVLTSVSAGNYNINLDIPERIFFTPGSTSATLTGAIPANLSQYFILRAAKGQTLTVSATPQDKLQLILFGVDGTVLKSGMGEGASFSGTLPSTQDYILALRSMNPAQAYTLNVSIPSAPIPVTGTNSYTVQKGDTLYSIAVRFHTTVSILLRANPDITNRSLISVGEVIYLPGATITLSNGQVVYVTQRGDSMGAIARQFNTTLSTLISVNPQISNPSLIYTGQRINIP